MTYVTAFEDELGRRKGVDRGGLFGRLQLGFQGFQTGHYDVPFLDLQHSCGLKPGKIARNELTHRANL